MTTRFFGALESLREGEKNLGSREAAADTSTRQQGQRAAKAMTPI
jgi:hypothetical protein